MDSGSVSSSSTMATLQIDAMKKAQDVAATNVLGVLQSSSAQTQQTSSAIAGLGQNIDIKA